MRVDSILGIGPFGDRTEGLFFLGRGAAASEIGPAGQIVGLGDHSMTSNAEPRPGDVDVRDLPGLLAAPSWLAERVGRPGLRVVDLRDSDAYEAGHVPGAAHLNLSELGATVAGCENVLIPPAELGELMAACGISNGDAVVAYDDQWGLAAARLVWALHRYGHERVAVLDGGWDRWHDEGGPVGEGKERLPRGSFEATPRLDVLADADWIARRIEDGNAILLDTRTPMEFERGHLPGAIVWDWFNAVPTASWNVSRDPEELRAEWRTLGVEPSGEIVVYCRSGMRAAHTWLVLRNAGFSRVRLYDGSWQEWAMRGGGGDGR